MAKIVLSILSALVLITPPAREETNKVALLLEKWRASKAIVVDFSRSFVKDRSAVVQASKGVKAEQIKKKEVSVLGVSDNRRPNIPSVTLSDEVLDMIWKETRAEGINYYTFLALIKAESNFDAKTVYHNDNGTTDYGLVQMNSRNVGRLAKEIRVSNLDVFNPDHNIRLGIEELIECREYWEDTYQGEKLEKAMLLAYNRGRAGSERWIDNKGTIDSSYTKKVMKYKKHFAQEAAKHS
ncbi:transglycosylase SLT domain-containing protein [Paenibacillus apiarius]|uniref:Lytic transglycosylase domain-containing protein n=1 Tax=Paenibacillus apiarius TaxID=46240 RepID=A0ABT4DP88_9BACL|nr:transglycosylase SLT domain-containing protein [Paenibacillus apiarius]MCY9517234.1 lytic transglycosylase domain-containing protein [Paenibacillus apiarius]MCY9519171.1 lytic transglycosylase domain-containing protein [Paenibacillus apiarius]MCY9551046.1 lytic transglycosylase domain-containing protein [Paenibacillus apiarius]MCY9560033.1 lytic transglycosylase domain-containing protein [Paenibacillus apiarius]MCY9683324.1 lytic transglycosylase domain-containing protein [Paenibacillus api